MNKLRTGIVGSGLIAKARHIPALLGIKNRVNLVAICDMNKELAKKTAHEFRIPHSYGKLSEMLSKEKLDVLDICVPPQAHATVAIEAIDEGCHVIMEKPMALKVSDCEVMIDASIKHGTKLCVIHNNLFHLPFLKARKLISEGRIGDFVGMRIFLSTPHWDMIDLENHWYHKLPGGVLGETGPHVAYMSLAFLSEIHEVDILATTRLKHPWAPYDEFRIELNGERGVSSAALSYTRNCWEATVDLFGTEAALHIDLNQMTLTRHALKELKYVPIAKLSLNIMAQIAGGLTSNVSRAIVGRQKLGTEVVIERFVESILKNSPAPVSGEDGKKAVNLMEKIIEQYSSKYGIKRP